MAVWFSNGADWEELHEPVENKDEFGIITIVRTFSGAVAQLQTFVDENEMGSVFRNAKAFRLESQPHRTFPEVKIHYRKLSEPQPPPMSAQKPFSGTATMTVTEPEPATKTISFIGWETVWTYLRMQRPSGPQFTGLVEEREPIILSSVIKTDAGQTYVGNAPANLVSALTMAPQLTVIGPESKPKDAYSEIFECADTVRYGYVSAEGG